MDITNALIAKSDQLNAIDIIGGPCTITVVAVNKGNGEQPVNIVTDLFGNGRPFKPSKTVLRILGSAEAWGPETSAWVGRRMTIYREPSVTWAGEEIGGIRVSALSHIDKQISFNLATSKTKHAKTVVQPLPDVAPLVTAVPLVDEWVEAITAAATIDELQAIWAAAGEVGASKSAQVIAAKDARKKALA